MPMCIVATSLYRCSSTVLLMQDASAARRMFLVVCPCMVLTTRILLQCGGANQKCSWNPEKQIHPIRCQRNENAIKNHRQRFEQIDTNKTPNTNSSKMVLVQVSFASSFHTFYHHNFPIIRSATYYSAN